MLIKRWRRERPKKNCNCRKSIWFCFHNWLVAILPNWETYWQHQFCKVFCVISTLRCSITNKLTWLWENQWMQQKIFSKCCCCFNMLLLLFLLHSIGENIQFICIWLGAAEGRIVKCRQLQIPKQWTLLQCQMSAQVLYWKPSNHKQIQIQMKKSTKN